MKKVIVFLVYVIFCSNVFAQKPLRHFMQSKDEQINTIPYGNNPLAEHYVQSKDAKIYY